MAHPKVVGIKELKNNLSAYLKELKVEHRILITDRNRVVAELREPSESPENSLREEWIRAGMLHPPSSQKKFKYKDFKSPVKCKDGTALKLLNEEREEKWP